MLYNFISFFFMLNFIIAIICESYIVVSMNIKSSQGELKLIICESYIVMLSA
jgi:hypothetical protein